MFGILFRVMAQIFGIDFVLLGVARAARSPRNRIDISTETTFCFPILGFYPAMSLRGTAKNAEAAKVEIEKIRTGIDAPQHTIELEIIAFEALNETTREHNLKHITTLTMLNAPPDVGFVLLVG